MSTASAQLAEVLAPSQRTVLAANGYLARYSGLTLTSYRRSLEMYFGFLLSYRIDPLDARRPHVELYMREFLEKQRGNTPSSVQHRMVAIRGFYKFAVLDDYIVKDPTAGAAIPKIWRDEWRNDWLTKDELKVLIDAANASDRPADAGLVALLAIMGMRIAECLAVQIEDYDDVLLGHRVLRFVGKGGKPATMPLPVPVLRMLDRAAGGRTSGPLLIRDRSSVNALIGLPLTYKAATIALDRLRREARIERHISPHMFRRGVITAGLDGGIAIRDMQILARHSDPRTTSRYDRGAQNLDGHAVHEMARRLTGG